MDSGFEWDRILLAVALLAAMFLLPALVIWRDQVRDRHRFGAQALSRPVRYAPDGQSYREGAARAAAPEWTAGDGAAGDGAARQRAEAVALDGVVGEAPSPSVVSGGRGR
ncbi:hypothetical protein FF36_00126 [Frankia torreyi]|uniref:Uncharacterized protein n=1 Tax=Frankia torreyi TaxID=1856 RepID=A0A0D8BN29_9ACTN|nr:MULTISPECIES: hypothetical protein [Frankia]KJE25510.1 hypothetical protein FF36_00126 [Frankia torreyi]KQM06154.1 hypothetical protein FF86_101031 [Frankia sp. CpI1-P]